MDAKAEDLFINQKRNIWEAMLDADLNRRYFGYLYADYHRADLIIKSMLAIFSSSTVASWAFWEYSAGGVLWKSCSAIVTVIAIVSPFLNLANKLELSARLKSEYGNMYSDYRKIYYAGRSQDKRRIGEIVLMLGEREHELALLEEILPVNKLGLISKCQDEVLAAHGLE